MSIPFRLIAGATTKAQADYTLLRGRSVGEKTLIFVCQDYVCGLPVEEVREALETL